MGGAWGAEVGGSNIPPDIRPFGGYDFRPLGPLSWNDDDDDGDDHIKNPSANLPCADNLSRHHVLKNPQIRSYFDDPLSCCTMQLVSKQSSERVFWG